MFMLLKICIKLETNGLIKMIIVPERGEIQKILDSNQTVD